MLALVQGFAEKDISGTYTVAAATASGLAMSLDASNTAPNNPTPYGNSYGSVIAASPALTITQSGTTPFAVTNVVADRELGWLLQPASSSGPTLLNILTQVYDESVAAGNTCALALSKAGNIIGSDQYSTGTGAITPGTTALNTICGINAGQPRVQQAGDAARLKYQGKMVTRGNITLALFQIL